MDDAAAAFVELPATETPPAVPTIELGPAVEAGDEASDVQPRSKKSWHSGSTVPHTDPGGQYQSSSALTHCTEGFGLKEPAALHAGLLFEKRQPPSSSQDITMIINAEKTFTAMDPSLT